MQVKEGKPELNPTPQQLNQQMNQTQTSSQEEGIEVDIKSLIFYGRIERDVTVGKLIIRLHSLSEEEKNKAKKFMEEIPLTTDLYSRLDATRVAELTYAITKIKTESKEYVFETEEEKSKLYDILKKLQKTIIDLIYVEYNKILSDQIVLLEEGIKKNSQ